MKRALNLLTLIGAVVVIGTMASITWLAWEAAAYIALDPKNEHHSITCRATRG